ncbi:MAG: site-specific integrase, partial [Candidatus Eisenbacteria bacterium]|nr:site-specific integrase [Candidatus Eisenbacteria bacterium]
RGVFTAEELRDLFPAEGPGPWGDHQTYTCFLLAATTGMRCGEVLALRWRDVDFEASTVTIVRAWKDRTTVGPPKSGKPRAAPLPPTTVSTLERLRAESRRSADDDLVFCYVDGSRLGGTWWRKRFVTAMKRAGLDREGRNLQPHSLRHSLATILEARDYNPRKIRAALGWSGERIRENYSHLNGDDLREQAEIVEGVLQQKP